jgi:hypothetical protein
MKEIPNETTAADHERAARPDPLCLVLLTASVYRVNIVPQAQAQTRALKPELVQLVYWDDESNQWKSVVTGDGRVRTTAK